MYESGRERLTGAFAGQIQRTRLRLKFLLTYFSHISRPNQQSQRVDWHHNIVNMPSLVAGKENSRQVEAEDALGALASVATNAARSEEKEQLVRSELTTSADMQYSPVRKKSDLSPCKQDCSPGSQGSATKIPLSLYGPAPRSPPRFYPAYPGYHPSGYYPPYGDALPPPASSFWPHRGPPYPPIDPPYPAYWEHGVPPPRHLLPPHYPPAHHLPTPRCCGDSASPYPPATYRYPADSPPPHHLTGSGAAPKTPANAIKLPHAQVTPSPCYVARDHSFCSTDREALSTPAELSANKRKIEKTVAKKPTKRRASMGKWTEDEDNQLRQAVKKHAGKNWKRIASHLPGRSDVQCLHRWQKVLKPGLIKGPWTPEEDATVIRLVKIHGQKKWSFIARQLKGRLGKQCKYYFWLLR